jgi:hypothetical protein
VFHTENHTGEYRELPAPSLPIETFWIATLRNVKWRVDEHLEELSWLEKLTRHAPLGAERRNERDEHDQPRVDHQAGHLRNPADVLHMQQTCPDGRVRIPIYENEAAEITVVTEGLVVFDPWLAIPGSRREQ